MSKRSGLSRLEDLKRGFIDIGRHRYILHKFDMEPWRDKVCPICKQGFTEEPRSYFMAYAMHRGCSFGWDYDKWLEQWYAENEDEYRYESMDDAYNTLALEDEERECGS